MQMINTIIVDDEPLALSLLKAKLNRFEQINIIGECKNGREAIEKTLDLAPDLLFLDIHMPGIDGFEVIKKLQSDMMPLVIFATAYEQYALDAFDVNAVDYILKPLDDDYLVRAIERATKRLANEDQSNRQDQKSKVLGALNAIENQAHQATPTAYNGKPLEKKVVIKDGGEITVVKQQDIEWIDAAGDYCCLHANGQTHIKRTTVRELLQELDETKFKRIHRSTIVNFDKIVKVHPLPKSEYYLELSGGEKTKASRTYKDVVRAFLTTQ